MFEIENIDYHITDVCNLKCASCNHFCPLVPNSVKHKPIEQIKADLLLLSKHKNYVSRISLLGGEPTLHPDLREIAILTRELFPRTEIVITTNGVRSDVILDIYDVLMGCDIYVYVSKYPFKDGYNEHYDRLVVALGDRCINVGDNENFQTKPLANREVSTKENSLRCRMRYCTHLLNGKLYLCNYAAQLPYLKNYFGDEVKAYSNNDDYVDLNVCTIEDIEHLMYKATPKICEFCKECTRGKDLNMEWIKWHVSQRDINEWIDNEI